MCSTSLRPSHNVSLPCLIAEELLDSRIDGACCVDGWCKIEEQVEIVSAFMTVLSNKGFGVGQRIFLCNEL